MLAILFLFYTLYILTIFIDLILRLRRIAVLTKYTTENKALLLEGIAKAIREKKFTSNFNTKVIPLSK